MSLSNIPTHKLIEFGIRWSNSEAMTQDIDQELEQRVPNETTYHFGDCAGQVIFVPIEPECDSNGQAITEQMIGYDEKGNEIWS